MAFPYLCLPHSSAPFPQVCWGHLLLTKLHQLREVQCKNPTGTLDMQTAGVQGVICLQCLSAGVAAEAKRTASEV